MQGHEGSEEAGGRQRDRPARDPGRRRRPRLSGDREARPRDGGLPDPRGVDRTRGACRRRGGAGRARRPRRETRGPERYEVCRRLREVCGQGLPIVFVSADRTEPSDRVAGLLLGGDDYLAKPVGADELLARVRRHLLRLETWNGLGVRLDEPRAPGVEAARRRSRPDRDRRGTRDLTEDGRDARRAHLHQARGPYAGAGRCERVPARARRVVTCPARRTNASRRRLREPSAATRGSLSGSRRPSAASLSPARSRRGSPSCPLVRPESCPVSAAGARSRCDLRGNRIDR